MTIQVVVTIKFFALTSSICTYDKSGMSLHSPSAFEQYLTVVPAHQSYSHRARYIVAARLTIGAMDRAKWDSGSRART